MSAAVSPMLTVSPVGTPMLSSSAAAVTAWAILNTTDASAMNVKLGPVKSMWLRVSIWLRGQRFEISRSVRNRKSEARKLRGIVGKAKAGAAGGAKNWTERRERLSKVEHKCGARCDGDRIPFGIVVVY